MVGSIIIDRLVTALRCLPGVGPKSAQRMALHLLERNRDRGRQLAAALVDAMDQVGHCRVCRTLTELPICHICASEKRDRSLLCVVETPADVAAIEQGTDYRGLYFVLLGHLSPLDGVGPEALGMDTLARRLLNQHNKHLAELIIATSSTVEGEATAHYVGEIARQHGIRATRLAHGIPLGGELEFTDSGTLAHALSGRREFGESL
jgi:recombination protein RecR